MKTQLLMNELKPGQQGIIKYFLNEAKQYIHFLEMGLLPGTLVQSMRRAPLGDAIQIKVNGILLFIRNCDASSIALDVL